MSHWGLLPLVFFHLGIFKAIFIFSSISKFSKVAFENALKALGFLEAEFVSKDTS
jgi:hypothetical protein